MKTLLLIPIWLLTIQIWLLTAGILAANAQQRPLRADTTQAHRWYNLALGWQNKGQHKRAHELFRQAAVLFRQQRQWGRQLDCDNQIARSLLHMGNYEEALQKAWQVIRESRARFGQDNAKEVTAYWVIGHIYKEKGDYEKALEYHGQALHHR
jgi:tetratricopeptide (TPR) repeat protein